MPDDNTTPDPSDLTKEEFLDLPAETQEAVLDSVEPVTVDPDDREQMDERITAAIEQSDSVVEQHAKLRALKQEDRTTFLSVAVGNDAFTNLGIEHLMKMVEIAGSDTYPGRVEPDTDD